MKFLVSMTGVDEKFKWEDILDMSFYYPFIEWGVLCSYSRQGVDNRYPSFGFIREFGSKTKQFAIKTALHLCGNAAKEFLKGNRALTLPILEKLTENYCRIQVNIDTKDDPGDIALHAAESLDKTDKPIIFQYNENNLEFIKALVNKNVKTLHILKDASGGKGVDINDFTIPESCQNIPIGFAGGLGPKTIQQAITKATEVVMAENVEGHGNNKLFWLDMESKIRNSKDCFSSKSIYGVANAVEQFLESHINKFEFNY